MEVELKHHSQGLLRKYAQDCELFILDSGLNLTKIRDVAERGTELLYSKKLNEKTDNNSLIKADLLTGPIVGQICITDRAILIAGSVYVINNDCELLFLAKSINERF